MAKFCLSTHVHDKQEVTHFHLLFNLKKKKTQLIFKNAKVNNCSSTLVLSRQDLDF